MSDFDPLEVFIKEAEKRGYERNSGELCGDSMEKHVETAVGKKLVQFQIFEDRFVAPTYYSEGRNVLNQYSFYLSDLKESDFSSKVSKLFENVDNAVDASYARKLYLGGAKPDEDEIKPRTKMDPGF